VIKTRPKGAPVKIELVVFDMAGTTVSDENSVNRNLRAALEAAGVVQTEAAVNRVMGLPKPDAIAILVEEAKPAVVPSRSVRAIHRDFVRRSIKFYESDPSVREIAGAGRVFARLKDAGIFVALDTGFDRTIARVILDRLGWSESPTIDAVICSDEVARGRPHPDMIRALMSRLGITDAKNVAKVGDTPADLHEGHNAGCGLLVGVTGGTHTRIELEGHPHTHLIETIAGLPGVLGLEPIMGQS
jgi:phosphonatase-like hydrolase